MLDTFSVQGIVGFKTTSNEATKLQLFISNAVFVEKVTDSANTLRSPHTECDRRKSIFILQPSQRDNTFLAESFLIAAGFTI